MTRNFKIIIGVVILTLVVLGTSFSLFNDGLQGKISRDIAKVEQPGIESIEKKYQEEYKLISETNSKCKQPTEVLYVKSSYSTDTKYKEFSDFYSNLKKELANSDNKNNCHYEFYTSDENYNKLDSFDHQSALCDGKDIQFYEVPGDFLRIICTRNTIDGSFTFALEKSNTQESAYFLKDSADNKLSEIRGRSYFRVKRYGL